MKLVRLLGALVLLLVAVSSPVMAFAAAEQYSGRKFYGVFEGGRSSVSDAAIAP